MKKKPPTQIRLITNTHTQPHFNYTHISLKAICATQQLNCNLGRDFFGRGRVGLGVSRVAGTASTRERNGE